MDEQESEDINSALETTDTELKDTIGRQTWILAGDKTKYGLYDFDLPAKLNFPSFQLLRSIRDIECPIREALYGIYIGSDRIIISPRLKNGVEIAEALQLCLEINIEDDDVYESSKELLFQDGKYQGLVALIDKDSNINIMAYGALQYCLLIIQDYTSRYNAIFPLPGTGQFFSYELRSDDTVFLMAAKHFPLVSLQTISELASSRRKINAISKYIHSCLPDNWESGHVIFLQ